MSDADRYLPLIYPMASALDYLPENALLVLEQPARCAERARDYQKQLQEDLRELQKRGQVALNAENFYLSWDNVVRRLADFPLYMTDAFTVGRTPLAPKTLTSIPAKQLPSYAGSAQAAAEDVKIYLKQGPLRVRDPARKLRQGRPTEAGGPRDPRHPGPGAETAAGLRRMPHRRGRPLGRPGVSGHQAGGAHRRPAAARAEQEAGGQKEAARQPPAHRELRGPLRGGLCGPREPRHRPLRRHREDAGGRL